jgi:hypothetical protein
MTQEPAVTGMDFKAVISKVKEGIVEAEKRGAFDPAMLPLKSLTLTLKTVVETIEGGALKITIPFIGQIGGGGSLEQLNTQTIVVTLISPPPPPPVAAVKGIRPATPTLQNSLVEALVMIHEGVQAALVGDPPFVPDNATVELNFGVSEKGEIEVVFQGSKDIENTNTLKLELGKTESESGKLPS